MAEDFRWRKQYLELEQKHQAQVKELEELRMQSKALAMTNENLEVELGRQKKEKAQLAKEIEHLNQEKGSVELQVPVCFFSAPSCHSSYLLSSASPKFPFYICSISSVHSLFDGLT